MLHLKKKQIIIIFFTDTNMKGNAYLKTTFAEKFFYQRAYKFVIILIIL